MVRHVSGMIWCDQKFCTQLVTCKCKPRAAGARQGLESTGLFLFKMVCSFSKWLYNLEVLMWSCDTHTHIHTHTHSHTHARFLVHNNLTKVFLSPTRTVPFLSLWCVCMSGCWCAARCWCHWPAARPGGLRRRAWWSWGAGHGLCCTLSSCCAATCRFLVGMSVIAVLWSRLKLLYCIPKKFSVGMSVIALL